MWFLGLAAFVGMPASANFEAKLKMTCSEVDDRKPKKVKLVKEKFREDAIVRACLERENGAATDADVELHALVFDSDTLPAGELRVVRRCDATTVCSLSEVVSAEIATKTTPKKESSERVTLYELIDVGTGNDGSMLCESKDSFSTSSESFKFKASCTAYLEQDGLPCSFDLKTGPLFEEEGICPP